MTDKKIPLAARILDAIRRPADRPIGEAEFNALALESYERQRALNPVYRRWCAATAGATGQQGTAGPVDHWSRIPALPVLAFKLHRVAAFPASRTKRVFMTSGTTRGGSGRGRHPFQTLALYDAAIKVLFRRFVLPDLGPRERIDIVFLIPSEREKPESSLSHMGARAAKEFGRGKAFYALDGKGVRSSELTRHLTACAARGRKVLIFSTTFALADYLDFLAKQKIRLVLPPGSRVMETGGYKGRRAEVARPRLLRSVHRLLGLPPSRVINEYGMTELSTQFYDRQFGDTIKAVPAWARVLVVDPATGRILPVGRRGLIRIIDLANQGSCVAVQTEDEGRIVPGGFEVLGRRKGADPRGCSLAFEELRGL